MRNVKLSLSTTVLVTLAAYSALDDDGPRFLNNLPWIFLAAWLAILNVVIDRRWYAKHVFKPSAILLIYISTSFLLGAFAYRYDLVLDVANRHSLYFFKTIGYITSYVLLAFAMLLLVWRLQFRMASNINAEETIHDSPNHKKPTSVRRGRILLSILILLLCAAIEIVQPSPHLIDPAALFLFSALYLSRRAQTDAPRFRIYLYLCLSIVLAAVFYDDRRLVALFLFTLLFMEWGPQAKVSITFAGMAKIIAATGALITLVIAMSMVRGVGEFGVSTLYSALERIPDYLMMEQRLAVFLHNFEVAPTLFHTYDAIRYVSETGDFLYGKTILKFLFLAVPREIFESKPDSVVHLYTSALYPNFRTVGGSWVPNILAEGYWNFGYAGGLIYLVILIAILDRVYIKQFHRLLLPNALDGVLFLSCYLYLIFLFRGSGLDLFAYYCILSFISYWVYRGIFWSTTVGRGLDNGSARSRA